MTVDVAEPTSTETLREQVEAERLQIELVQLQSARQRLTESAEIPADPWEYLYDSPSFIPASTSPYGARPVSRQDKARGRNYPWFGSIAELNQLQGLGRWLGGSNETAISALLNLTNYVIGTGFSYTAEPKEKADEDLARACQTILDEFDEANDWIGDLERDIFWESREDGEKFIRLHDARDATIVRLIEPEYLTEPQVPERAAHALNQEWLDWSFGIGTEPGDVQGVRGLYVQWTEYADDCEIVPASEFEHVKLNVRRTVKRGLTDFFAPRNRIKSLDRLVTNLVHGAADQAAISFVVEHPEGTSKDAIRGVLNAKADVRVDRRQPSGNVREYRGHKLEPGTRLDVAFGKKFNAGPLGQTQAVSHAEVARVGLQCLGSRWAMPYHILSTDSSNGNYASILEAGTPFNRAALSEQFRYKKWFAKVMWKVLRNAIRRGRLKVDTLDELRRRVNLVVEAPPINEGKQLENEQVRETRHRNGILSSRTWAEQADLDYDVELERGARAGQASPALQGAMQGALESVRTTAEARRILESVWRGYP